jgi:hypothetical protein
MSKLIMKIKKNKLKKINPTNILSSNFQVPMYQLPYFNIIKIHIITLENSLGEPIYHDFHLIYNKIETHTYKHLGCVFLFNVGYISFPFLFIYKLHQQSITSL